MKYYIGYFNKPWDKSEFTVICACPSKYAAEFILEQYKNYGASKNDAYQMLTIDELEGKALRF